MTQCEALMLIARRGGGVLTPADVIEDARNPESVLHGAFTWDDTEAAEKWRVHEAQQLIRKFRICRTSESGETVEHPVFIGLSVDRESSARDNPYRIADDVAKDVDLMKVAVDDALNELNAVKARHFHLKRLSRVWDAIEEASDASR